MSDETPVGTAADAASPDPDDPGGGPAPRRRPRRERRTSGGSFLRELPVLLVVAVVLALLINTFLVKAFFIPSGSMEQTLHGCPGCSGDRVLVNKVVYRLHDPRPGDVVVFAGPESWAPEAAVARSSNPVRRVVQTIAGSFGVATPGEKDFIKRVIAVGGQTVQCCDEKGRVTIDGRPLDEPYTYSGPEYEPAPFGPVTVPEGRLWVMGDHRDQSADSRAHITDVDQGTISSDDVIGKAFVIIWPVSRWHTLGTPGTFGGGGGSPWVMPLLVAVPLLVVGIVFVTTRRRRRAR